MPSNIQAPQVLICPPPILGGIYMPMRDGDKGIEMSMIEIGKTE
jgi:hypothetical protein